MKNKLSKIVLIVAAHCVGVAVTYAANVHFKRNPTFTDNGTTLTSCISLAGLGNQDVTITLTASGEGSTSCVSPGGNAAPGQNRVPFSASTSQTISASEIKNGTLSVCSTTPEPGPISGKDAGCPNNNWTGLINDVTFTSSTITVVQGGVVVLQQSF